MSRRGWLLFAAMGVIWGIPYLLIKVAVGSLHPTTLVFLRTAMGALLLLPFGLSGSRVRALLARWRPLLAYTVIEIGVPWLLLSDAERRLSSSLAGLLVATVPLIGALLARITRAADRLAPQQVGGLAIGFAGVAALVGFDVSTSDLAAVGEMAVVTVCYAVGPMIVSRYLGGVSALGVVAASLLLAALAYTPIGVLQLPSTLPGPSVIAAVAVLGVVCTALAFLVFFALIAEVGPVRALIITYVNPAVALALGILLLKEPLTPGKLAGFLLIIAGSVLSTRRRSTPLEGRPAPADEGVAVASP